MSYCGNDCISCSQVCDCIKLTSPEGSIIIDKNGCTWSLEWNPDSFIVNSGLLFTPETRQLCMEVNGQVHCVIIPDSDDQYLSLSGNNLRIHKGDGTIVNSIDLNLIQITFSATSSSLNITPGGSFGHSPNIEIVPSSDANNIFILGTDGKPYVPESLTPPPPDQTPITPVDTNTIDITATGLDSHTISANVKYQSTNSINLSDNTNGLNADLKIDPTSTIDISVTVDGLKVDNNLDVVMTNIPGLSFTKTRTGNTITFTPTLDYIYIASQVCDLCPPPTTPCLAPTVTISNITDGTLTVGVSPLANGDSYDISIDNGISWLILGATSATTNVTNLTKLTTYNIVVRLHCVAGGTVNTNPQASTTLDCANISNLVINSFTSGTSSATATLTWTPASQMTLQTPGYKLSTGSTYTNTSTTTSNTSTISGLLNNRLYDFRVNTDCHNPNTSTSNIVQGIGLKCPTSPSVTSGGPNSVNYSFDNFSGTSISNVKIELLNSSGSTVLQTQNKVPPSNSGTFTGLSENTQYQVRITVQAQGTSQLFQLVCSNISVTTSIGTIYARLTYEGTPSQSCAGGTQGFRNANAIWRTYSDPAGTIPIVAPVGAVITYDRIRLNTRCNCPNTITTIINNTVNYTLNLAGSSSMIVPTVQKYSGESDWYRCNSIPTGNPCSGGGGIVCIQDNFITNEHLLDDQTYNSTGSVTVEFL